MEYGWADCGAIDGILVLSNLEQEEAWLQGWDELDDLRGNYPECYLLLPEYCEVSLDKAQEWIQNAAYESKRATFRIVFYKGKNSILMEKGR